MRLKIIGAAASACSYEKFEFIITRVEKPCGAVGSITPSSKMNSLGSCMRTPEFSRIVFIKISHGYGLWFWSHKIMCLDSFFCLLLVDENKRELCWIFNYGWIAIYMCLNSSLFSRVLDVAGFQSYPSYDIGKKNPPVFNFFFVILSPSIDVITEWLEFKGLFGDIFQNSSQKIIFII